ncbi:MAG: L-lactate dehydrogenase [Eubacteriales bacterium]|nr:L-lactate dehydrogenase [Eubacteriales bacterium]
MSTFYISGRKVAIIGAGFVGASIAYALTIRKLAREIVLIDVNEQKARGEALDIQHGIPDMGISSVHVGGYEDCKDCDLIIITAGRNRRPGETRLDLIAGNSEIIRNVVDKLKKHYTKGVIMMVSNPVDVLVYQCARWMDLPNGMVFGTGCILDSSRLTSLIADYTHLSTEVVKATVVGEHGDAQIPVWSRVSIAGVPIQEYCENVGLSWTSKERESLAKKVREMGAEIIRGKEKTHYGIATCVCHLAEAVLNQRLTIAPVSTVFQGEYGIRDVSLSVPSIIGVNGVEKRLEERWSQEEFSLFRQAADKMKAVLETL